MQLLDELIELPSMVIHLTIGIIIEMFLTEYILSCPQIKQMEVIERISIESIAIRANMTRNIEVKNSIMPHKGKTLPELNKVIARKARVLVVDDEVLIGEVIREWLKLDGYDCDFTTGIVAAQEMFKRKEYDLLISDITMPGGSGLELLIQVKQLYPDLAVVMATAVDDRGTADKALALGADSYVIKPFHMNEFLINIANILENKRLTMENSKYNTILEEKVRDRTAAIRKREEEIAMRLITATGCRDGETGEHIKRIGLYSVVMAMALGWDQEKIDSIKIAAPMHDVGKIGIPDDVLQKPCRLSAEELEVIKEHPRIGATILGESNIPLLQMAVDIALCHHEKWDGTGYPGGLSGEGIPEAARIVAIIDVYDALCHDRVYRESYNEADVLAIMDEKRGSHFDPEMYDCFRTLLPSFRRIRQECTDQPCY
ncbi:MAG: HD domain-containing phosphohydrolase [Thermodesulfobacteriota bacterium]